MEGGEGWRSEEREQAQAAWAFDEHTMGER